MGTSTTNSDIVANSFEASGNGSGFVGDLFSIEGTDSVFTIKMYEATVTVANGATTGKEAAINMPANFLPVAVGVYVTTAATNAVTLTDIGDDADTDSYVDGIAPSINSTGFKGIFACNGIRGAGAGITGNGGATTTADEVEVVVSSDPGATGVTMRLTFLGIVRTAV